MTEISELVKKHAVENAMEHGEAHSKNVLGKVLAEDADLRKDVSSVMKEVEKAVREVNKMSKKELEKASAAYGPRKKQEARQDFADLPNVTGPVCMRFAPNPSGPLHIGHARTAIMNDEYVKKYGGKLILRIEDTDPARVDKDAYRMVEEELKWLGVVCHETIVQSGRLAIYRDFAARLIKGGHAYVCSCGQEKFKEFKDAGKDCPCRANSIEKNIELWNKMQEGDSKLVLNLKTDMKHKNPAMRDFPIMRVTYEQHPLTGREWDLYPLMNFSVTVDDHLLGMTHVLRGKDHIVNTERQMYIYGYFGWKPPEFIHNGLLSISGVELSTSVMKKGIQEGKFDGWADLRLGTLRALKRRGIEPEAIRAVMRMIGVGEVDSNFEWDNLYAENRRIIEPKANRYFFVPDPEEMWAAGLPNEPSVIKVQLHPGHADRGYRELKVKITNGQAKLFIAKIDAEKLKKGEVIRLKNFCNLRIDELQPLKASYVEGKELKVPIIQWLPEENIGCEVLAADKRIAGFCELGCKNLNHGDIIQFERFGFCRVSQLSGNDLLCYFSHP